MRLQPRNDVGWTLTVLSARFRRLSFLYGMLEMSLRASKSRFPLGRSRGFLRVLCKDEECALVLHVVSCRPNDRVRQVTTWAPALLNTPSVTTDLSMFQLQHVTSAAFR